jgi:hypothetical protein
MIAPARFKSAPFPGVTLIPGGTVRMGSDRHYPVEAPAGARLKNGWIQCV